MDELRRSSGELAGMMGGSAGPSPPFLGFFSWVFSLGGGVALALFKMARPFPVALLMGWPVAEGHVVALRSTLRASFGLGMGAPPPSCPWWA